MSGSGAYGKIRPERRSAITVRTVATAVAPLVASHGLQANSLRRPVEFNRNGNENAVWHADHDEHESDTILIVGIKRLPMLLLKMPSRNNHKLEQPATEPEIGSTSPERSARLVHGCGRGLFLQIVRIRHVDLIETALPSC